MCHPPSLPLFDCYCCNVVVVLLSYFFFSFCFRIHSKPTHQRTHACSMTQTLGRRCNLFPLAFVPRPVMQADVETGSVTAKGAAAAATCSDATTRLLSQRLTTRPTSPKHIYATDRGTISENCADAKWVDSA